MMEQHDIMRERGWERVAPWFLPQCLPDVASGAIATLLDLRGHNLAPISACSTGAHAIMEAAELIRRGDADVVLAGGGEACIHPLIIAGFTTMKGLGAPRPGEGPETASRPFDATRDGFVCAEGATVLVLESVERAERPRRAHPRRGDRRRQHERRLPRGHAPPRLARASSTMMRRRARAAGIDPAEVGYINPHGTSTPQGDAAETKAIKEVFGDHAHAPRRVVDEVGRPATSSAARARSRSRSARSRCATGSCRRRSTTAIPIPSATSTTCPRARARPTSSTRSRTRWASAGTTAASSCAATTADAPSVAQARIWPSPRTTYFVVVMSARPIGPARVQARGRVADLGAEPELAAVGEARRGVDVDAGPTDAADERVGGREALGHDRLGVAGRVALDVVDRLLHGVDGAHRQHEVEVLGRPVVLVGGHARRAERLGGLRVGAQLDAERRRSSAPIGPSSGSASRWTSSVSAALHTPGRCVFALTTMASALAGSASASR